MIPAVAAVVLAGLATVAIGEPPPPLRPPVGDPRIVSDAAPPDQLTATGGPYVAATAAGGEARRAAIANGAANAQVTGIAFMTYGDSVRVNGHARGDSLHPHREIYVVHIDGAVTTKRGPPTSGPRTYLRTYWIVDATSGELIGWGSAD